jgi:hypothetical protein
MAERSWIAVLVVGWIGATGCYYKPEHKRAKAHPSYLSEVQAEALISKRLADHGVKFISNMKLQREGAAFEADGYDRDLRVGYEYRSHEGRDFEGEEDGSSDGLTEAEIEALYGRQDAFREFFLIVPEGTAEQVEQVVDAFVKKLYEWEVLKRKTVQKPDELFPEQGKKQGELLPWEATGDLKKKREEMERREADRKAGGGDRDDEVWQNEEGATGKQPGAAGEPWPGTEDKADPFGGGDDKPDKKPDKKVDKPAAPKPPAPRGDKPDDVWGDEEEDF